MNAIIVSLWRVLAMTHMAGAFMAAAVAAELPTATSSLFSASGNCVFCHDQGAGALLDRKGQSVSITDDWRGTMMAHAFQDPLWRAVMETETLENPGLKSFIEDKCQTCHAPMARTQYRRDAGRPLPYAQARRSALASDGVSCTLCHQIQPAGLGHPDSFTGQYTIHPRREIFGPYEDVFTMPMQRHVNYTPEFGAHVQDSALCATCHTLFTPVLAEGRPTGERFPEQVPYLEWKASDFSRQGKHCQDCHMPRFDEPVRISARPPWLEGRQPFWQHEFVGGNAFMLQLMANEAGTVRPHATDGLFAATIERARAQLRRAVQLKMESERQGSTLTLRVRVVNLTGHKFPTGHPYRRAWLRVRVRNADGRTMFESGAVDARGALMLPDGGWAGHEDVIERPDQVQVYESVMGDVEGRRTYSLLRASSYLKDNRIPPRGFGREETGPDVAVRGAARQDANFNGNHSGGDTVTYRVALGGANDAWSATVEMLYQAVPPEAVKRLMTSSGEEARKFARYYQKMDHTAEVVAKTVIHSSAVN